MTHTPWPPKFTPIFCPRNALPEPPVEVWVKRGLPYNRDNAVEHQSLVWVVSNLRFDDASDSELWITIHEIAWVTRVTIWSVFVEWCKVRGFVTVFYWAIMMWCGAHRSSVGATTLFTVAVFLVFFFMAYVMTVIYLWQFYTRWWPL